MNGRDLTLGQRRGRFFDIAPSPGDPIMAGELIGALEKSDIVYRTLCSILFNFVPQSGHPGGSISSGRIVQALLFGTMDYDFSNPDSDTSDILSYAAGHKAMGLYAAWALRNELVRISQPEMLANEQKQLRLEDLLGFRRNPLTKTPLFKKHSSKALDGHPTPATPFVRLATGASGVGVTSSVGLALGALDAFGPVSAPWIHVLEGECGLTPGRVHEALSAAASAQIHNLVLHVDWNQASIDSNCVCRTETQTGDYVQWTPAELFYLHDWNVISVQNGFDFSQILAAQRLALSISNKQPTAIIYSTIKGWKYGIEGRASHGAGHQFCSDDFYKSVAEFEHEFKTSFPRFNGAKTPDTIEHNFFDCLMTVRHALEKDQKVAAVIGQAISRARGRLSQENRALKRDRPRLTEIYENPSITPSNTPSELELKIGQSVTLRAVLGDIVNYLNHKTGGAIIASSADLLESTSLANSNKGFQGGFYNAVSNPTSRLLATGGICEDAMGGILSGLSAFGQHIGIGSSYGAFMAPLQHIACRLHSIGQQTKAALSGTPQSPFIMICAHAGPKTGEDGPTHADPQALQLLSENFPKKSMITLTPWDPQEIWPLLIAALRHRPAVIAPFVTRPPEVVIDRAKFGLPAAAAATKGLYALRKSKNPNINIVLQGTAVATIFVNEVLPELDKKRLEFSAYYVASAELFDLLPYDEQQNIFPESVAQRAIGITEFTLPTLYRWVSSESGRRRSLYPFKQGHFLGSGQGGTVLEEGGLDAVSQLGAILES